MPTTFTLAQILDIFVQELTKHAFRFESWGDYLQIQRQGDGIMLLNQRFGVSMPYHPAQGEWFGEHFVAVEPFEEGMRPAPVVSESGQVADLEPPIALDGDVV